MTWIHKLAGPVLAAGGLTAAVGSAVGSRGAEETAFEAVSIADHVPSREEQLRSLRQGTADNPFDVFIVGGGATGTGCALDAVTRCIPKQ